MNKITFAMIEVGDYGGIVNIEQLEAKNIHNAIILARAEALYLNKILILQKEIRDLYEPKLIENIEDKINNISIDSINDIQYKTTKGLLNENADDLWR